MTDPYRMRVDEMLTRHLHRTGANFTTERDPYAHAEVRMLRDLLRLVEAACEDEHLAPEQTRRIIERVLYGATPSPSHAELVRRYEQLQDGPGRTSLVEMFTPPRRD